VFISFDATVYDRQEPMETLVSSYLFSREDGQSAGNFKKNAKHQKNLHMSEKTLNLRKMNILSQSSLGKPQQTKKMRSLTPKSISLNFGLSLRLTLDWLFNL